jgi:hypothetical protein
VSEDAVGTLVGRNRPSGEPAFGVGSHCDSNRNPIVDYVHADGFAADAALAAEIMLTAIASRQ